MEKYLKEMAEILEEDTVTSSDRLDKFESWDSLATLSVVAMADSKYGVKIASKDVNSIHTIGDLYELIMSKKAI
jgi:acyl carrier protein